MGQVDENAIQNNNEDIKRKKVVLTVNKTDQEFDFEQLSINFDSSESEILESLDGIIREANLSIKDEDEPGTYLFTVRKSTNTETIYVYPKDPAGN